MDTDGAGCAALFQQCFNIDNVLNFDLRGSNCAGSRCEASHKETQLAFQKVLTNWRILHHSIFQQHVGQDGVPRRSLYRGAGFVVVLGQNETQNCGMPVKIMVAILDGGG